ncbi:MAG: Rrf2 family iron-sulfur cluster assembly transcriptional regulator [Gammaproteobacteria bacterium]|jgi:Rrf2 family iron-sulfur cluster assembly transcriptional regulator
MKLTTKGRYAVTAMLDLAIHYKQVPVNLADISARQVISLSYLEQLFSKLRKHGLVQSARGPGGGYMLAKQSGDISLSDIVIAVDETVDATRCGGQMNCQGEDQCLTHDLWEELSNHIRTYMSGVTLADLANRHSVKVVSQRQDAIPIHIIQ